MANVIAVPAPAPTISLGKLVRFAAKALGAVLMLIGVMAIVGTTALCGLTVYGAKWMADQLPVLDGPGYEGTSAETAMVVQAMNESEGVSLEYAWVDTHLPFSTYLNQSLIFEGGRTYDVLLIDPLFGDEREVWFDITDWYGVW